MLLSSISFFLFIAISSLSNAQEIDSQSGSGQSLFSAKLPRHYYISALLKHLVGMTSRYNRTILPDADNENEPFVVQSRLYLIRVQEINENQETFVATARFQLTWYDSALVWQPEQFGGLTEVIFPPNQIWFPDLHIANSVENSLTLGHKDDFRFRVTSEGRVWFHPTGRFQTRCKLDLRLYPFDYQICSIVLESVTYTHNELVLIIRSDKRDNAVALGMYSQNPMWTLENADGFSAIYKTGRRTGFSRVQFYIIMKRRPDYFINTFLVPLILLSILQVLTYLMPIKFVDRVPQATVVLLTTFFFQGQLAMQLPRTSEDEAFVQSFLNLMLGLSVMSVSICVVTLELVDPDDGLPMWGLFQLYRIHQARQKGRRGGVTIEEMDLTKLEQQKAPRAKWPSFDNEDLVGYLEPDIAITPLSMSRYVPRPNSPSLQRRGTARRNNNNNNNSTKKAAASKQRIRYGASTKTELPPVSRQSVIAALINWIGFLCSLVISVIYPVVALVAFLTSHQPDMPRPSPDNVSVTYYGD